MPTEALLGQFIPLHYQYALLQDESRITTFRRAIDRVIAPDMKVLELGGGTGIMSFFAATRASKVWCVERIPQLAKMAQRLLQENGVGNRVEVVLADAFDYLPPEPVDVVICEMLHAAMLREKQIAVLRSFLDRHQKHFGRSVLTLPDCTLLSVQPIQRGFTFDGYRAPVPIFQNPEANHSTTRALAPAIAYATIYYQRDRCETLGLSRSVTMTSTGTLDALRFLTRNVLSVQPVEESSLDWHNQHLVLPLQQPLKVEAGQRVDIDFSYVPGGTLESLHASIQVAPTVSTAQRRAA